MSSSYGARTLTAQDSHVPIQSQIVVTLLLPAAESPAFVDENVRKWQNQFLTGTQTYTVHPPPSNGPPGATQRPETLQIPVCRSSICSQRQLTCQYRRVFVRTICRSRFAGTKDYDHYHDLTNDQKHTLRQLYETVRTTYENNLPEGLDHNDPTEWDEAHHKAYTSAFDSGFSKFKVGLSHIALNPQVMTATKLITTVTQPLHLQDPAFNLHEILPVDLSNGYDIAMTGAGTSMPAEAARSDQVNIEDFVVPRLTESGVQWMSDRQSIDKLMRQRQLWTREPR
jgi:hypothetical protein